MAVPAPVKPVVTSGCTAEHRLNPQKAVAVDDKVHNVCDYRCIQLGGQSSGYISTVVGGSTEHDIGAGSCRHGTGDGRGHAWTGEALAEVANRQHRRGTVCAQVGCQRRRIAVDDDVDSVCEATCPGQQLEGGGRNHTFPGLAVDPDL